MRDAHRGGMNEKRPRGRAQGGMKEKWSKGLFASTYALPNTERTIGAKGRSFLPLLCCQRRPLEYVPAVFY